jgi:hypothetical protein
MNNKYLLIQTTNGDEKKKEYKTLIEIANDLNVDLHIIRKINHITEGRAEHVRPHHNHKNIYETIKIHDIKKQIKAI